MEPLLDPKGDRFVKSVKPPPHRPLYKHLIWPGGKCNLRIKLKIIEKPDWKMIRDNLAKEGRIDKIDFIKLI